MSLHIDVGASLTCLASASRWLMSISPSADIGIDVIIVISDNPVICGAKIGNCNMANV